MKKLLLVLGVAVAVLGLTTDSRADVRKGEFLIAPMGSFTFPLGDYPSPEVPGLSAFQGIEFGENVQPGFGVGGTITRVVTSNLALGVNFGLSILKFDDEEIARFLDDHIGGDSVDFSPDFKWRTVHLGAVARRYFSPEKSLSPYLQLGGGIYLNKAEADIIRTRSSGSHDRVEGSESFTNAGVSIGPGALIRISKDVRISAEAILNNVFSEEKNVRYVNFTVGMVIGVTPQQ